MLISLEQVEQIRDARHSRLVAVVTELMREHWGSGKGPSGYSDDEIESRAQSGIAVAESYGLTEDRAIARFVNLQFVFGEAFPDRQEHAWATTLLRDTGLTDGQKIDRIWEMARRGAYG